MRTVSPTFLAAVTASHGFVARADVISNGAIILSGLNVSDGSVTLDRTADVRGHCTVTVADPALIPNVASDVLTPYGNELRLFRGVRYTDGDELVSLGVFRIQSFTVSDPGRAITIEGLDRSQAIREANFEDVYTIGAGTEYQTAIQTLITQVLPGATFDFSDYTGTGHLAPLLVFDDTGDGGRWNAVTGMAEAMGAEIYFDGDGTCVLRRIGSLDTSLPRLTVSDGVGGVLVAGSKGWSREGLYNAVIATSSNPDAGIVRAFAADLDATSPTYYFGPFGKKPRRYSSPFIADQAQAESAALALLRQSLGATQQLTFTIAPNPALEPGDVINVRRGVLGINDDVVIDSISVGLRADSPMETVVRSIRHGAPVITPTIPLPPPPPPPPPVDTGTTLIYRNDFRTGLGAFGARTSGASFPVTNGSLHNYTPRGAYTLSTQGLVIVAEKIGTQWYSGLVDTYASGLDFAGPIRARIRCRMSNAKGMWPTLWWLPRTGSWPTGGEWDVFESISDGRLYWTIHCDDPYGSKTHVQFPSSGNYTSGVDVTQWHIIESDLIPGYGAIWYLDGVEVKRVSSYPHPPAPFDRRYYPIMNMAVGSTVPGFSFMPDGTTPDTNLYEIDYFEVYSIDPAKPYVPPVIIPVDSREAWAGTSAALRLTAGTGSSFVSDAPPVDSYEAAYSATYGTGTGTWTGTGARLTLASASGSFPAASARTSVYLRTSFGSTLPAEWTAAANAGGSTGVDTNRLTINTGATGSYLDWARADLTDGATTTGLTDVDIYTSWDWANPLAEQFVTVFARCSNDWGAAATPETYVAAELDYRGRAYLVYRLSMGTVVYPAMNETPGFISVTNGGVVWNRLQVDGTTIRAKWWVGAIGGEPVGWSLTGTQSAVAGAGRVKWSNAGGSTAASKTCHIRYVDVGTVASSGADPYTGFDYGGSY